MTEKDNVLNTTAWAERTRASGAADSSHAKRDASTAPHVRPAPTSAAQSLADEAKRNGGSFDEPVEYRGAFGRTLFDDRGSEDKSVTVVFPADRLGDVPSQALMRIVSMPDRHEYIASVTAGPFCEPDGLSAQAPQLVVTAVHGHQTLPRHHGRLQATIIGEKGTKGIVPARHRPRPNAAVHLVGNEKVSEILNLVGDVRLGLLNGHDDVEVRTDAKLKSVFPRHTAHIGTTGGGKSTGVGRVLHQFQKTDTCVIVFDVEGEYTNLDKPNDNPGIIDVLEERGLKVEAIRDTHVYRLRGCAAANPRHPSLRRRRGSRWCRRRRSRSSCGRRNRAGRC